MLNAVLAALVPTDATRTGGPTLVGYLDFDPLFASFVVDETDPISKFDETLPTSSMSQLLGHRRDFLSFAYTPLSRPNNPGWIQRSNNVNMADSQQHTIENSEDASASENGVSENTCPECSGNVVKEPENGEFMCNGCGLILSDTNIDRGPDWRAFDQGEKNEKSRVGAPATELLHDKGLSTNIGWRDQDAYGKTLSSEKRTRLQRLRTWDERFRTKDAHERNIKEALGEIRRMASALGLSEPTQKTASVIYRRAVEEDLLIGRCIEGIATASLYAAARQQNVPRPLSEFSDVSRVEHIRIQRAYRYLSRELGLEIEPEDPKQYLPRFASSLSLSDEAEQLAKEILTVAQGTPATSGKSPVGLAAAAVYAAANLTNTSLTQETVADVADVSEVTIRNRYQDLLELYGEYNG
jgi:transcription initiation factor TFIIB